MQNEGRIDNRKTMIAFVSNDFSAHARVEYAHIEREINQSEHGLSFTAV